MNRPILFGEEMLEYHCPRWEELPNVDLYMDQLLQIVEEVLGPFQSFGEEKVITSAMVNNYVKQKVVLAPVNKRYTKYHVVYLIIVCFFKKMFTINEICELITIQINTYDTKTAYNYFCNEVENALKATFIKSEKPLPQIATKVTLQTDLLRAMVLCLANKMYVQKLLEYEKNKQADEK